MASAYSFTLCTQRTLFKLFKKKLVGDADEREHLCLAEPSMNLTAAPAISPHIVTTLAQVFSIFDRDGDSHARRFELGVGLLSSAEPWREASKRPVPPTHEFGMRQCDDPTLDALSFVECSVARSRLVLAGDARRADEAVDFAAELTAYLAGCAHPTTAWLSGACLGSCSACALRKVAEPDVELVEEQVQGAGARIVARPDFTDVELVEEVVEGTRILISSDWHVEPWYISTSSPKTDCDGAVCRFAGANETNMFSCRDPAGQPVPSCTLDGRQDPPISLEMSHLASAPAANASVHLFVGDTQAHSFEPEGGSGWAQPAAITSLLGRVLDAEIAAFGASGVVWTAGNNDGPHNTIFHAQDASTMAWAAALLERRIVTDDLGIVYDGVAPLPKTSNATALNQTAFFALTGFYCKALPALGPSAFAVVLNTNLGGSVDDTTAQGRALNATLAWIHRRHGADGIVYLLGHHPTVMSKGAALVAAPYRPLVRGVLAGHVHYASATTSALFTQIGALTQDALDTAFFVATVSTAAPEIRLKRAGLHRYTGKAGEPAAPSKWS